MLLFGDIAGGLLLFGGVFFLFLLLFVIVAQSHQHASAGAVTIDGAALTAAAPCLDIESAHHLLADVIGQVDCHADGVVHPLLYLALHAHLVHPIHIVGGGFIIR